jgi:hypothetical protein
MKIMRGLRGVRRVNWQEFLLNCEAHDIKFVDIATELNIPRNKISVLKTRPEGDIFHAFGNALLELHRKEKWPFDVTYLDGEVIQSASK